MGLTELSNFPRRTACIITAFHGLREYLGPTVSAGRAACIADNSYFSSPSFLAHLLYNLEKSGFRFSENAESASSLSGESRHSENSRISA